MPIPFRCTPFSYFLRETLLLVIRILSEFERADQGSFPRSIGSFTTCSCGGSLAGLQEISAPNFCGRKPHNLRDSIHMPFHCKNRLRRAETAVSFPMREAYSWPPP